MICCLKTFETVIKNELSTLEMRRAWRLYDSLYNKYEVVIKIRTMSTTQWMLSLVFIHVHSGTYIAAENIDTSLPLVADKMYGHA